MWYPGILILVFAEVYVYAPRRSCQKTALCPPAILRCTFLYVTLITIDWYPGGLAGAQRRLVSNNEKVKH
jgi:hypothetical protein